MNLPVEPLRKRKEESEKDYSITDIERIYLVTDVYCEYIGISFDECMKLQRALISLFPMRSHHLMICLL